MLHINGNVHMGINGSASSNGHGNLNGSDKGKLSKGHVLVLARDRIAELEREGEMLASEGRLLMSMMDEWVRKGAGDANLANMS